MLTQRVLVFTYRRFGTALPEMSVNYFLCLTSHKMESLNCAVAKAWDVLQLCRNLRGRKNTSVRVHM